MARRETRPFCVVLSSGKTYARTRYSLTRQGSTRHATPLHPAPRHTTPHSNTTHHVMKTLQTTSQHTSHATQPNAKPSNDSTLYATLRNIYYEVRMRRKKPKHSHKNMLLYNTPKAIRHAGTSDTSTRHLTYTPKPRYKSRRHAMHRIDTPQHDATPILHAKPHHCLRHAMHRPYAITLHATSSHASSRLSPHALLSRPPEVASLMNTTHLRF